MKFSCCCGLVTGFVLALLLSGGVYYFFYCREHPGASERGVEKVEQGWNNVKSGGDKVLQYVKPLTGQPEETSAPSSEAAYD